MSEQPIDTLIGRLEPARVSALVQVARRGGEPTQSVVDALRDAIETILTAVSTSERSVLMQLVDATTIKERRELASKMHSIAPEITKRSTEISQRERIAELEGQLAMTREEAAKTREELQKEIDGLQTELELRELMPSEKEDDKSEDDDDDEDENNELIPGDTNLYITRLAWDQAIQYVMQWRLSASDKTDAKAFVDWLHVKIIEDRGALATFRVLQRAAGEFDLDWIDPRLAFGQETPEETRELLRRATTVALTGEYGVDIGVVVPVREPYMTHVVFTHEAWPAVIGSLRLFNADNWHARPIEYLRWLHADDKRKALLALMSWGAPLDSGSLLAGLPESNQRYFEQVVQLADDLRKDNKFDFVPVPLAYVRAQITDALRLMDDALPKLQAELTPEQLQATEVYTKTYRNLVTLRKQLPIDWLNRLSRASLQALVDDSMINDTERNRWAIVETFENMLVALGAENITRPIRWII